MRSIVGRTMVGRGADVIIIGDPIAPAHVHAAPRRTLVNTWFDAEVLQRLNDKAKGAVIIVMQRLHHDDLCGHLLRGAQPAHSSSGFRCARCHKGGVHQLTELFLGWALRRPSPKCRGELTNLYVALRCQPLLRKKLPSMLALTSSFAGPAATVPARLGLRGAPLTDIYDHIYTLRG